MDEIILVRESAIEYTPNAGYLCIICEMPFICDKETLYVENSIPEKEKFLVTNIDLPSDNTLKVDLDSNDHVILKSQTKVNNYLFQKIIGDFRTFKAHNIGDDKLKIVSCKDKLDSFRLYRELDKGRLFSFSIIREDANYYLINYAPWKKNEVSSFEFEDNKITCHLKNGNVFSSDIICVPYIMDLINHTFTLLNR